MALGTVLVLAAVTLFLFNRLEDRQAGEAAEKILPKVEEQIRGERTDPETEEHVLPDPYDPEMTVTEIDSYGYIGYLSIPVLGLELPVMSEWDYTRLKIAPCRYYGSTKTHDLVVCAHNYERHFGSVKNLVPGDEVYFTDMDGIVWSYEVETVEILAPNALEDMTAGGYDLTLFTCTYSGQSRETVRCREKAD